jgi:hypothetical protein
MTGCAYLFRLQSLKMQGMNIPAGLQHYTPVGAFMIFGIKTWRSVLMRAVEKLEALRAAALKAGW